MLALLGFLLVVVFMVLIMTKKASAICSLILVPVVFGLISGASPKALGKMILKGANGVAPTALMLTFAIIYFGLMMDTGMFDPIVEKIIKIVKGDPLKVIVGTAIMASLISFDGDGSTTFMIVVAAMLPIYKKLKISPLILASVALLANSIMNILPWGGPTARVMSSLKLDASQVFTPLFIPMIICMIFILVVAFFIGKRERKRLGIVDASQLEQMASSISSENSDIKRPKLFWVNLILTILLIVALFTQFMEIPALFVIWTAVALLINYPNLKDQKARIEAQASNVLIVVAMVLAAGVLTGVLSGTKMADAMATSLVSIIPPSLGHHLALFTALISGPGTYFLSNDAYYFGIVPIIAKTAATYGITAAQIARASLMAQSIHFLSPLVGCVWVLLGLTNTTLDDLQKYCILPAIGIIVVNIISGAILGVIPL